VAGDRGSARHGMLTKYSVVFFVAGLLAALVLTRARRYLDLRGSGRRGHRTAPAFSEHRVAGAA